MRDEINSLAGALRAHLQHLASGGLTHVPARGKPAAVMSSSLNVVREELGDCTRCKLSSGRTNIVFGVGSASAPLVFVGEAPGASEDAQGEPFVGEAGQLLTKMIITMGWRREDVYIANIIKCRPPGNRTPDPDEIAACEPFLQKQLGVIKPRMIVALGKFAAQWLTGQPESPIGALRGRFHEYQGIRVMPTYHPAYLLRTPSQKRVVWGDLQLVMQELERVGIRPPGADPTRARNLDSPDPTP